MPNREGSPPQEPDPPSPNPATLRLVRTSRALPIALLASVVGLVLCGVTYAVAGETVHTRDIDLIDPLPAGVVTISNDVVCATVPGSEVEQCRRRVTVRRDGTPTDELADELATLYRDRGFDLNAVVAGNGRTYFGSFGGPCGPQLFLGGSQLSGLDPTAPPGALSGDTSATTTTPTTATTASAEVTTTTDPAPVDPAVTASTTAVDPAADGSSEPIVSSPPEPGAPNERLPTETVPTETLPTETSAPAAAPFQATPDETVPGESTPAETTTTVLPANGSDQIVPPSIVRQPPSMPVGRGPAPSDVITIEISEPYPGIC